MRASFSFLFAAVLMCGLALSASAQTRPASPQVSEATANELGKLRELSEAKDFAPAVVLIDRLLGTVPAESYDRTLLSQIKVQIYLTEGNYPAAIAPLETAVTLGERHAHLSATTINESLFLLAQLYQQQGAEAKDPVLRRSSLDQSIALLRRWKTRVGQPTPEGQLFAASLFYQRATVDAGRVDAAFLDEARLAAEEGLVLQTNPSPSLYLLILAVLQQTEDYRGSAELLELLLEKSPSNTNYWQQLASLYLNLASNAKTDAETTRYNLRALMTIERAQALGFLDSPKENFNRVALYLNVRQFDRAISLLEKGLADGSIENTRRNWETLASACQQAGREEQAIAALQKAVGQIPLDGQLEFTLAQFLYAQTRLAEARAHLESAIRKGNVEKPGQTRLFLAYITFEQQAYDEASRWAREAGTFDDAKKEDLARLIKAIDEASRPRKDVASKT